MKQYIDILIKEASIPVSALIIKNNKIIAKAHNTRYKNNQPIEHAEINAIRKACKKLKTSRLDDCTIITTLEPCMMCMGAIVESHIKEVYYLLPSKYIESSNNFKNKIKTKKLSSNKEYSNILSNYFKNIR